MRPGASFPSEAATLSRSLTRLDLIVIGVAQIIGAGIFVISGVGVKIAGPGIILSFLIAGAACTLAARCYAELASMIPQAGSAYSYSYAIFGEMAAWVIGWDLILEYGMGAATVAAAGALVSLGLMLTMPAGSWWRLGLWLMLGIVIYFCYGYYSSRLRKGE